MEIELDFYETDKCDIAVALHMAGVPFAFPDHPSQNTYRADTLAKNGQRAGDLHARGIPGKVTWGFRYSIAGPLLQAYKMERDAIDAGAKTSELDADPVDFIKIAAHYAEVRRAMLKLWQLHPSEVVGINAEGREERVGINRGAQ